MLISYSNFFNQTCVHRWMMNVPLLSTFILGALHSLEPGHGKSIVALHTSQSRKISDGFSLLASLLLTHFLLVIVVSFIIYFNPVLLDIDWLKFAAPVLVICYGLFLLVKSRRNTDEYLGCSCSHEQEESKKSPILLGIIAGLTPCPSVFSPVVICMSNHQFESIFYYLIAYISGVISVFIVLFLGVFFLKNASSQLERLVARFNPHLVSGIIMVLIGLFYLMMGLTHTHG